MDKEPFTLIESPETPSHVTVENISDHPVGTVLADEWLSGEAARLRTLELLSIEHPLERTQLLTTIGWLAGQIVDGAIEAMSMGFNESMTTMFYGDAGTEHAFRRCGALRDPGLRFTTLHSRDPRQWARRVRELVDRPWPVAGQFIPCDLVANLADGYLRGALDHVFVMALQPGLPPVVVSGGVETEWSTCRHVRRGVLQYWRTRCDSELVYNLESV